MLTSLTILFTVVVLLITYFIAEKVTRYNWAKTKRTELEREKRRLTSLKDSLKITKQNDKKYVSYEITECIKNITRLDTDINALK